MMPVISPEKNLRVTQLSLLSLLFITKIARMESTLSLIARAVAVGLVRKSIKWKKLMLLLIDNYDSFTYNLVHYFGEIGEDVVKRNDEITPQDAFSMRPDGIVLSPGPCDPDQAGFVWL